MVVMFMYLSSHGTIIYGFLSYHKWFLLTIERSYVILTYHCENAMSSKNIYVLYMITTMFIPVYYITYKLKRAKKYPNLLDIKFKILHKIFY